MMVAFLHSSNEQAQKEIKKKSIYNTIKRFRYLEINLTKETKAYSLEITKH
jgi:t-SNARE complex subunit (syntaxin)